MVDDNDEKTMNRLRRGGWSYKAYRNTKAYAGGVDLSSDGRDDEDHQHQDSHMERTDVSPATEADPSEATIETELFGSPRRIEGAGNGGNGGKLTTFDMLADGELFLRLSGAQQDVLTKIDATSFSTSDGRIFKVDNADAKVMKVAKVAGLGNSLTDLTSDPKPVTPMTERPSESYGDDGISEDKDLHLGSADAGADADPANASTTEDEDWQYAPDMQSAPTTVHNEIGQMNSDQDKRSPFVKVFRRLRAKLTD